MSNSHAGLETLEREAPDQGGIPLLQIQVKNYKAESAFPRFTKALNIIAKTQN